MAFAQRANRFRNVAVRGLTGATTITPVTGNTSTIAADQRHEVPHIVVAADVDEARTERLPPRENLRSYMRGKAPYHAQ